MPNYRISLALEGDVNLCRSEIIDRVNVMKRQECTVYRIDNYLKSVPFSPSHIDTLFRCKMVQWCFSMADFLNIDRETVCISVTYLDRFLSSGRPRARLVAKNRRQYQLASMTALFMAIKLFEPEVIDTIQLAELSRGRYKSINFSNMELDILSDLEWHLNGPTATSFLVHFLALLPFTESEDTAISSDIILEEAKYQIELSTMDYNLVMEHPSKIAAVALINSIRISTSARSTERFKLLKKVKYFVGIDPESPDLRKVARYMNHLRRDMASNLTKRTSLPPENAMTNAPKQLQIHAPCERISPNTFLSTPT